MESKSKKEIFMAMDVLELLRATDMMKKAKERIRKAFIVIQRQCELRSTVECIGFEGTLSDQCGHVGHPQTRSMYHPCCVEDCPNAKI